MCTVVDFEVESGSFNEKSSLLFGAKELNRKLIQRLPLTREVSKSLLALWKERDCL